jgi:type IV secretory pathway VirB3-like protein
VEYSGISKKGEDLGDMTDAAVVSYADRVRDTLRKRFHIARITRQSSSTAQILLAGVAAIAAAFTFGATTVVSLAAGSVAMPQLAETFDAGGRAVAYQQAVAKISTAESAYFRARAGRSPVVPNNLLTVEGALLYEAINGATDAVELFQAGILPSFEQMKRANAGELQRLGDQRSSSSRER